MSLEHFRMLIHEPFNKDPGIVIEEASITILDIKSTVCMAKTFKDTKHIRNIFRRVHFVMYGQK